MKKLLYATTNPGKLKEMRRIATEFGLYLLGPADLGINLQIKEIGKTLIDNAILKSEAYLPYVDKDTIIIGDDTGVEIAALNNEPGIYVRRWKDHIHDLTDQEIVDYCLTRMNDVPVGERQARFHTVLSLSQHDAPTQLFDGYLDGEITTKQIPIHEEGMPFWRIFYIPQYGKMLGEIQLAKIGGVSNYPTHRESAFRSLAAYLATCPH